MNSTDASTISSISTNYRQKGKQPSSQSKLFKGFIHDATSKLSVGSIPAKFETIVYRNQSNKAFGSSNPRFIGDDIDDLPGPQEYNYQHHFALTENKGKESISKRGYGGLITKEDRQVFKQKYINSGPGAGNYEQVVFFNDKKQFSTNSSQILQTKLSSSIKKSTSTDDPRVKVIFPGPGEYDQKITKSVNTFKSAFISKSKRDEHMKQPEAPAPGQYNIKRNIINKKPTNIGPSSSFYPELEHKKQQTTQERLMNFLEDPKEKVARAQSPGPCDYDVKLPNFNPEYLEKQQSSPFFIQQQDRFGDPIDKSKIKQDQLGPGFYEIKGQLETIAEEQNLVSGAVFMSETKRKPYGEFQNRQGPNTAISYLQPKKKDFHLNLKRKFV